MSDQKEVSVTINIADTVPLRLYNILEGSLCNARRNYSKMERDAASLRIEVAALTQALEVEKSRLAYANKQRSQFVYEVSQLKTQVKELRGSDA